ncbi:ubiquitin carboxyl-terminal hydrolase, partial [Tothia fuscella]
PYAAATDEEKKGWKGWVDIESNPSIFNVMLREFGVAGVKVQEIYSLDEDILATLPLPIYGIIFLFQYQIVDEGTQNAPCPSKVWFANQLRGTNACGTIALVNIVNNIPEVDLGEQLKHFKDDTMDLDPMERGRRLDKFDHLKAIHNSFARKIDILQLDLGLWQDREAAKKPTESVKDVYDNDSAYHYVAYMPIDGTIWKLDGLDDSPQNLGECDHETWLNITAPLLQERMAEFSAAGVNFNMMALVKDPFIEQRLDLASNIKLINAIEERLTAVKPDWRTFDDEDDSEVIVGIDETYIITSEILDSVIVLPSASTKVANDTDPTTLLEFRSRAMNQQAHRRRSIRLELDDVDMDEKKASDERKDYGPFVQHWLMELAECGELRGVADKFKVVEAEKKRLAKFAGKKK